MSQHDFNIANQSFPATRTDLNNALVALASNSSGDAEPATKYANQWWYETDTNTLKLRNEANDAWISIAVLDQSGNAVQSITTAGITLGSTAISATGTDINQLDAITRGSILYGNASGATARLAKGAADTVLTSDGTDISWAAASSGGGYRTLISTTTISNVDATVLVEGMDDTYDQYQFVITDLLNATTTASLRMRFKSGGSIDTTAGNYEYANLKGNSTTITATVRNSDGNKNSIDMTTSGDNAAPDAALIIFDLFNPAGTTYSTIGFGTAVTLTNTVVYLMRHSFTYGPTAAVTGAQFFLDSGYFGSGTIKLYGIT